VLFPGSRQQEIEKHLGPFIETARIVQAMHSDLDVLVSRAPSVSIDATTCPFPIIEASSWTLLRAADAALCKSGTTTLEAAVAGCPLIIGYRAASVDYFIATQVATVTDIGMPNIIAGRRIVPEYVQDELDARRMAPVLSELLDPTSGRRREMIAALSEVRAQLGTAGAAKRVAALAVDMATAASSRL
jgi:lipid-A-disaccharide synthase